MQKIQSSARPVEKFSCERDKLASNAHLEKPVFAIRYAMVYMGATLAFWQATTCDRFETTNMTTRTTAGKTGLWG
jgi:hypothetical protein